MKVPAHLGIIMDGNGRWATARGLDRSKGHLEGLKATRRVVRAASEAGVRCLSLYVFSTENWKRPPAEVSFLMALVTRHLERELDFYRSLGLRVLHSGDRETLPREVLRALDRTIELTAAHRGMAVNLALGYGGRDELLRAVGRWSAAGGRGRPSEDELRGFFDAPSLPDMDLVIRTAGELRISNFFLWQAAYAEFLFSPKLWPDFGETDLLLAFEEYGKRERRFGAAPAPAAREGRSERKERPRASIRAEG